MLDNVRASIHVSRVIENGIAKQDDALHGVYGLDALPPLASILRYGPRVSADIRWLLWLKSKRRLAQASDLGVITFAYL